MVFNWFKRKFGDSSPQDQPQPEVETAKEVDTDSEEDNVVESTPQVAEDYLNWAKAAYKNIQERQQESDDAERGDAKTQGESVAEVEPEAETQVEPPADEPLETENVESVSEVEPEAENGVESAAIAPIETETVESFSAPAAEIVAEVESAAIAPIESETVESVEEVEPEAETETEVEPVAATEPEPTEEQIESVVETQPDIPSEPESIAAEATESTSEAASVPFWATEDRQARLEKLKATADPVEEPPAPAPSSTSAKVTEVAEIAFDEGFLWSAEVLASQGRRPEDVSLEEISWLKRLRQGLEKTRRGLINQLKAIVGQGPLNQAAVAEIEALLLQADVGIEATDAIISRLQQKLKEETLPPEAAIAYLKQLLREMLESPYEKDYQPTFIPEKDTLNIWLLTGVNGVGKTTTIGKIAHLAQKSGYKCLIGAADTFRAAAVEQVKVWGQRSGIEVIANPGKNVDPAAVVFDAIAAAQSRGTELLLVDTAGRLQNKKNLMEELSKIRRIVDKKAPNAKIESLLVLDSTLGQNGLRQAQVFAEAAKLSGVVITKLDGTAKGGVALAVVKELGLPIRFIGAGEGIEDLRPFSSYEFVEALLNG